MPHTVDIVVSDMARALAFYRLLGLPVPEGQEQAFQVEVPTSAGYSIGFVAEEAVRRANGTWVEPVGQRIALAFRCDTPAEVNSTYAALAAAGHPGTKEPWDVFWGQRCAFLRDPDGNRVDLFAPSARPDAVPTVLVTGGASGIGAGLARAFHARGATVVIAGRDPARLARVAGACPGMETEVLDVADPASIARCAAAIGERHPDLDTLVNNAGIQRLLDFAAGIPPDPAAIAEEVNTNLLGLINVTSAFLPLLRRQPAARLVQVGSGLAFVPLVRAPVYSATKAAVHAFTVALREQLRGTAVKVVELIPPVVATELHRGQDRAPPRAMPLDAFVAAAMAGLDSGKDEVNVGLAKVLRVGARVAPGRFLKIINAPRG
ncbi:SDR family NAD(P)-dependent oxidoreductase [Roseomonas sp. CCTCC AB2023176]|uniref:SDR family NAD(P)-dependent oxidoreductase n=1 Tax=Roseomonas sp. CCTCC AB2023176 TaxID=3342640 RepID=UPI0035D92093